MVEVLVTGINIGGIAPIYGYFLFSIFVIFIYQAMKVKKILINGMRHITFWLLLISGLIYAINYSFFYGSSLLIAMILYVVNPVIVFTAGYTFVSMYHRTDKEPAKNILYAIAIGCGIHIILNLLVNIGNDRWHMTDFWGNIITPATNLGSLNIFIFSLFPCICVSKIKKVKWGGLALFFLSLLYSFILGTRTQIVALILVSTIITIIYFIKHFEGKISKNLSLKIIFGTIITIISIIISYKINIFNIQEKIAKSNLALRFLDRYTASSDYYRFELFIRGVKSLIQYPLGGNTEKLFFHNYWLDVGHIAGIIPVIMIVLYDLMIIFHVYCNLKNNNIDKILRYALLSLNIGIFLNFCMEPIMEGYLDLFYRFCLINGLTEALYYKNVKKRRSL